MNVKIGNIAPQGIFLSLTIAVVAYWISAAIPLFSNVLIALLLGIVISQFIKIPASFLPGIQISAGKFLELSILFLALGINVQYIIQLGWEPIIIVLTAVVSLLLATVFLARKFHCPGATGWLVGFGTAICGSSAIAALAPTVSRNKEETGLAIAVVNLYGLIGMIVLPLLLMQTNLSSAYMALIVGATLHSVGNVAGAGFALTPAIGTLAVSIKLARVALLSPAVIFFTMLVRKKEVSWKEQFKLPWYLWGFIVISTISSLVVLPSGVTDWADEIGKFLIVTAMAGIGLTINLKMLWQTGRKGLAFGAILYLLLTALVLTFQFLLPYIKI